MTTCAIAFGYVPYRDKRRQITQDVAIECMLRLPPEYKVFCVGYENDESAPYDVEQLNVLTRNSQETIGNSRPLPYIKDIICAIEKQPYDYIGYVNSDILLGDKWLEVMQFNVNAHAQSRYEIGEIDVDGFLSGKARVIGGGDKHEGVDGFFFKRQWWLDNKHLFPTDLIVGEGEWDTCYRHILRRFCVDRHESRSLYHVYHDQKWNMTSSGFKNNADIWLQLQRKYPGLRAGETRY